MKRWLSYFTVMVIFAVCGLGSAAAQKESRPGTVIVPPTNVLPAKEIGRRAHTNFLIFVPAARKANGKPALTGTSPSGETPASLSCVYQTWAGQITGCPINGTYVTPNGGSKMIAIVDAYDYPTAAADFNTFSQQFGLPTTGCDGNSADSCLKVVYAAGSVPQSNCGWAQEEALDIEWAHSMAPNAQIVLVEAASNSNADLMQAVSVARDMVANAGGGEVSMSWGGSEFSTQSTYDTYFTGNGVSYFASSGDSGGKVIWPSTSPDVISAGGTSVNRDSNGNFTGETVWSSAGAGPSKLEPAPGYQTSINQIAQLLNGYRGTPDISFDADPYTGVSVYDSTSCQGLSGWLVFGGTSVSAPSLAGIFNFAGAFDGGWDSGTNTSSVQNHLYQNYNTVSNGGTVSPYPNTFYDVTSGSTGSYTAGSDWDFASGIGTLRGVAGVSGSTLPSFSLSASPSSLSVTQGSSTTVTSVISMTASGGFSGTVDLTASAGTSGLSVSLSQSSISGTQTSTLTVGAGTAAAGTYNVTVKGTGTDSSGNPLTSSTTVPVTVTQASSGGSFSLGASSMTITVPVNSSASDTITVTPSGGFTGSVSLTLSGLPRRTSSSFSVNPISITNTKPGSSTLTISTNRKTTTGTYPLTLTAASGSVTQTLSLTLIVGTPSSPDFSLSATPSSQSVTQGQSANYSVTASSVSNFSGTVALTASISPSGPALSSLPSVSVTPTTSGAATLTVSTTSTTTAGTYTITITGTSGSLSHNATVTLDVSAPVTGDFSLSATPSSQPVSAGSSVSYTVSVNPTGGFTGSVALSASSLPPHSSVSFSPTSVSGGSGTSTMTVTTAHNTHKQTYTITINGTSGSLSHSTSVQLTVQ